jgi:hypothetical protein
MSELTNKFNTDEVKHNLGVKYMEKIATDNDTERFKELISSAIGDIQEASGYISYSYYPEINKILLGKLHTIELNLDNIRDTTIEKP